MSDDKKHAQEPDDVLPSGSGSGKPTPDPEATAAAAPNAGQPDVSVDQLKSMIAALQGELDKKSAEAADKQDKFVRAVAETENVRRRLEREKEETAKYAVTKFAKDVLSIGDNFQRAISAVPKDAVEADPALKTLLDGVVLAERDFQQVLERHGISSIDPAGQPFNPHHHQAVMEREEPGVPSGTVLQVLQTGYLIDERCLRPAMVVVSRGGPKASKSSDSPEATPPRADES